MSPLLKDVRYTARALRKSPGFTIVAVLTLAIGIGANTAIFSVVDSVLLAPLPFADPEELVVLGGQLPGLGTQDLTASPAELRDYRDQSNTLEAIAAAWMLHINITGIDQPQRGQAALVSQNYLSMLRAQPMLGRDFEPDDTGGEVGYVAILSYGAWQRFYGGDSTVIGRSIRIDDDPLTIVGIMPPGFSHPGELPASPVDLWGTVDLSVESRFGNFRNFRPLQLIGRLNDGTGIDEARAEFLTISENLRREYPQSYPAESGWTTSVVPLMDRVVGDVRAALFVLFGSVGLVLLVACTNVANLLLARGTGRAREIAIRSALGGGRAVIGRQFVLESVMLGTAGGLFGLLLAAVGTTAIKDAAAGFVPRIQEATLDFQVLGFTLAVSLFVSVVFGLIPAVQLSRADMQQLLKEGNRGTSGGGRGLRSALVVAEVALSLTLLIGSGLLLKSFSRLMAVPLGFDAESVMTMRAYLPWTMNPQDGRYFQLPVRVDFFGETMRRVEELPEVEHAALVSHLPLRELNGTPFAVEGMDQGAGDLLVSAELRIISPNYFDAMSVPLLRGRTFEETEDFSTALTVLVDQAWMARYFPDQPAVGRRVRVGNNTQAPWREIVGVVGNVRQHGLDADPRETIYASYRQGIGIDATYVIKTRGAPEFIAAPAIAAIHTVDPTLPIFAVAPMTQIIADTVAERRLLMVLLSLFAVEAMILAAIGIYGVISQAVNQRTREIGIRVALGAERSAVMKLVLKDGLKLALAGVVVGALVSAAVSRVISGMLYSVGRFDPLVFVTVAGLALFVAAVATWVPALRATRVDPLLTMKAE